MTSLSVPRPGKIVCVGRNYAAHARELGHALPARPLIFFKPISALLAPGEAIVRPRVSQRVEYEAELAVVIGARARRIGPEQVRAHVAGLTCANDVTCRDLQEVDGQWGRAKGFDTFCPVLPGAVPVADWESLDVIARVNGVERQHGRVRDMIFPIEALIATISEILTLEPGDLVLTGTPEGVGPLVAGDVVEVEIPGVGVLRNPVVDE